jgi:hypothetical protein
MTTGDKLAPVRSTDDVHVLVYVVAGTYHRDCLIMSPVLCAADTPPYANNLVGFYTGESFTGTTWQDLSGAANHVTGTNLIGAITKTASCLNGRAVLNGGTTAGVLFPITFTSGNKYTIFHIAK